MGWKETVVGIASVAQVAAGTGKGSTPTQQLADHHQQRMERRMEQAGDSASISVWRGSDRGQARRR